MKEVPYFKFYSSEWISGAITLEDFYTQGLFINICAYYWFKSGELKQPEIKQRLKYKQPTFNRLIDIGVLKVVGENIKITFLDDQLDVMRTTSEKNGRNGKHGGAPKGNRNAQKNNPHSTQEQPKTTNTDKEEDKIKIKKENDSFFDCYNSPKEAFEEIKNDELRIENLMIIVRNLGFRSCSEVTIMLAVKHFFTVEGSKPDFTSRTRDDVKQHLVNWVNKNATNIHTYGN